MLTPKDIHYIVGLLSRATHPDCVEVELGSLVWDGAAKEHRDVDVTITVRNPDGSKLVLKGMEVKARKRKLTSEHVEQLIQKLDDMPDVTHRAIVSASGFYKPAVRKAHEHNVELFELKDWQPNQGFDFFQCSKVPAVRGEYGWANISHVHINPSDPVFCNVQQLLDSNPPVNLRSSSTGSPLPLKAWLERISKCAAKQLHAELTKKRGPRFTGGTQQVPANATVQFSDDCWVVVGDTTLHIREVRFAGLFEERVQELPTEYMALFRREESHPVAGCCISDFGDFGLLALMITEQRAIEVGVVPISERNKAKILKRRLLKSQSSAE